jgi:TRAP-type C4-dicarboxylate transport system permease small subunit
VTEPQPRRHVGGLRRIVRAITVIELSIGGIALLTILALVFLQALQRYLPIEQIAWTGEIARFSLVWLTFVVAGVLVTERGHIALEIVDAIPNRSVVRGIQAFALLVVAATGVGLVVEASALVATQGIIRSPVLRLPMSWVYIPVLVGAASTAIRATVAAIDVIVHGPVIAPEQSAEGEVSPA